MIKKSKIHIKGFGPVEEHDYRALIAIILVAGLIVLLLKGDTQGASVLAPFAGSVVAWYFAKSRQG